MLYLTDYNTKEVAEYHIVFAPKFRCAEIYGKLKADIGKILRTYVRKGVEIIEVTSKKSVLKMWDFEIKWMINCARRC